MANTFKNATAANIGETPVAVYTVPATKKSIVIGCSVTNIYGSTLPVSIRLRKGTDSSYTHIVKDARVETGLTLEVMRGNKIVLDSGDALYVSAPENSAFDCVVSVLEDV
jgi:hypothetical protein